MNSPPCHAAQNGWINSATNWLEKRTVISTLISSGVATTARTQGSGYGTTGARVSAWPQTALAFVFRDSVSRDRKSHVRA